LVYRDVRAAALNTLLRDVIEEETSIMAWLYKTSTDIFAASAGRMIVIVLFVFIFRPLHPRPAHAAGSAESGSEAVEKGISYYEDGSYEEAVVELLKALETDPSSATAAYYLGLTYMERLDYPRARKYLEEAVSLDPSLGAAYPPLAESLYALGLYEEAAEVFKSARGAGTDEALVPFLDGLILFKKGDYAGAAEELRAVASAGNIYSQKAAYLAGLAYLRSGNAEQGRKSLERAAGLRPGSPLATDAYEIIAWLEARERSTARRGLGMRLSYSIEFDDNVILRPSDDLSGVPLSNEKDAAHEIGLEADYTFESRGRTGLRAGYSLSQSLHYDLDELDLQVHRLWLTPTLRTPDSAFEVRLGYDYILLHNDAYLQRVEVVPAWAHPVGEDSWVVLSIGASFKDFLKHDQWTRSYLQTGQDRDALNLRAALAYMRVLDRRRGRLWLGYVLDHDDADGADWNYTGNKWVVAAARRLSGRLEARAEASYCRRAYSEVHSVYGKKRRDTIIEASPSLVYTRGRAEFNIGLSYTRNKSNLGVYDYSRKRYSAGVGYRY